MKTVFQPCDQGFFPDPKRDFPSFSCGFSPAFYPNCPEIKRFCKPGKPGIHAGLKPFLTFFVHPVSSTSLLDGRDPGKTGDGAGKRMPETGRPLPLPHRRRTRRLRRAFFAARVPFPEKTGFPFRGGIAMPRKVQRIPKGAGNRKKQKAPLERRGFSESRCNW